MDGCGYSEKPLLISLHPISVCTSSLALCEVSNPIKQHPNPVITKPYEIILKQVFFVVLKSTTHFLVFPLFLHVEFLFSLQLPSFLSFFSIKIPFLFSIKTQKERRQTFLFHCSL
jgi:hypothetical protein